MPTYTFNLVKYEIKDTRARHNDTNYVTAALSVNGQLVGDPQMRFMGDQNNGTFPVGFSWPNVSVPAGGKAAMWYLIMNSGHKNTAELEKALKIAVEHQMVLVDKPPEGQVDGEMEKPKPSLPVVIAKELGKLLAELLTADCDGPITPPEGRTVVWNDFELKAVAPGTTAEDTVNEKGNDSPAGCGGNSHYVVHVSVAASS